MIDQIEETCKYLKSKGFISPEIGIILGTGLGHLFIEHIVDAKAIEYRSIPNFPATTVESHAGKLILWKHSWKECFGYARSFSLL